jgi:NAD(P)-dependent dehydrogenase (short-subunit alcohol dehydrogenase family)
MRIDGSSIVVTGGASGLGLATARELALAGARVHAWDVHPGVHAAAAAFGAVGAVVDVTSEDSVLTAIARIRDGGEQLRGIVTCAGIGGGWRVAGRRGPHPLDRFRHVLEVNLVGTFNCVRLASQEFLAAAPTESGERGVVVMTSSIAAFEGQMGQAAYAASKGGVASLALTCARDLAEHAIRCVCIAPGLFATAMTAGLDDKVRAGVLQSVPFPQEFGDPAAFASLALEAIRNRMLNGCTLRLDAAARLPQR